VDIRDDFLGVVSGSKNYLGNILPRYPMGTCGSPSEVRDMVHHVSAAF